MSRINKATASRLRGILFDLAQDSSFEKDDFSEKDTNLINQYLCRMLEDAERIEHLRLKAGIRSVSSQTVRASKSIYRHPTKAERDSQRSKLYKAENVLDEFSVRLERVNDIELFISKYVVGNKALQSRYPQELRETIYVGDGRRRSTAGGDVRGIYMPHWSRKSYIVLHEIAHTITIRRHGHYISAHGREYCEIYLDLVRFAIGAEAEKALKQSFRLNKVKFAPKRTVTLSDEQKEAMRSRMQIARAKLNK